jgi:tetratricopeptide (TPR) repeat protein
MPPPCAVALAAQNDGDAEVARLQDRVRQRRAPGLALERLGYRFVARARARDDAWEYFLAEKSAECLDAMQPGTPAALLLRGHVLHQLHRFKEAETIARMLVTRRQFVLDYGLLGDALLDQGRMEEASAAYQKMIDIKPFYQSYVRAAHLRWMKGDVDSAIEVIRLAIDAASPRDRESIAWAWTRLAQYELQRDRLAAAQQAADTALAYQPDYAAALLASGRIRLAAGKTDRSLEPLRRAARLNPLPEYQWALAEALHAGGLRGEAAAIEHELEAKGQAVDPRTFSLYLATRRQQSDRAVQLATRELQKRSDIFTLDALAWALASADRMREAVPLMTRALEHGTQDGRLFLHAAVIASGNGRHTEAARWARKARALHGTLLPSELDWLHKLAGQPAPAAIVATASAREN